jgi:hypothetical protein
VAGSKRWVSAVAEVICRRVNGPLALVAEMRAVPGANASAAQTLEMLARAVEERVSHPPEEEPMPEPAISTGQERFADLAPGFAALERLVADLLELDSEQRRRPDEVVAYVYDANGLRVSELSASWTGDPARGETFKSAGASWMRSDPESAAVLLAAEDVILSHGVQPDYHDGEIVRDEENEARWRLGFNLASDKDALSPEATEKIRIPRGARTTVIEKRHHRARVVKGWAFMDLPDLEAEAVRRFLDTGDTADLPERFRRPDYSIYLKD